MHKGVVATRVDGPEPAPADHMAEVLDAAASGRAIRLDAARWLVGGIGAAVRRGDTLDAALGLSSPGRRSLQRQLLTLTRNAHLVRALRLVSVDEDLGTWPRCERLAPLVAAFMATAWPRVRRLDHVPGDWPAWRVALFHAARTDLDLPRTAGGLFALAQQASACCPSERPAMLLARLLEIDPSAASHSTPWSINDEPSSDIRRRRRQCDL